MATKTASFTLPSGRSIVYAITEPSSTSTSTATATTTTTTSGSDIPTVILSNSLCISLASWDRVVEVLASRGFRVLRYNAPGHGGSTVVVPRDLTATTFDSLADDVWQLLAHLGIARLFAWVGVSMGAAAGVVFAARHPGAVARLVPCDTMLSSAGVADVFRPRVAAARAAGGLDALAAATLERWLGRAWADANPAEAARQLQLMRGTTVDGFEACCAALSSDAFDLRRLAGDAGRGVESALLLVGEKDAALHGAMEELRRGIEEGVRQGGGGGGGGDPDASVELKVIREAGHVCYIDGFEQFCEVLTDFLGK